MWVTVAVSLPSRSIIPVDTPREKLEISDNIEIWDTGILILSLSLKKKRKYIKLVNLKSSYDNFITIFRRIIIPKFMPTLSKKKKKHNGCLIFLLKTYPREFVLESLMGKIRSSKIPPRRFLRNSKRLSVSKKKKKYILSGKAGHGIRGRDSGS